MGLVIVFHRGCIAPEFFEAIEFTWFGKHDMNYHIHIVDEDPLFGLPAFMLERNFAAIIFYSFFNIIGNGFLLVVIIGLADDKKIGNRFGNFPEIEANDLFSFFLLDGVNDCFENLTVSG